MNSQNKTAPGVSSQDERLNAGKFVNVLVIGTDLTFAKSVQNALNTLQSDHPDTNYRIFPGTQKEKIVEYVEKYRLHSVLIEEEMLDNTMETWLRDFKEILKKNPQNVGVALVLISPQTDLNRTKAVMGAGFTDQIIKPLDKSLFIQKMNMYHKDIQLTDSSQLFSMETKQTVDIGIAFETKSVSEYGFSVLSNKPLDIGSIVTLYANFIEDHIAATVIDISKLAEDSYSITMMFVGVTPAQTQSIRKFVRKEYAEEKQSA